MFYTEEQLEKIEKLRLEAEANKVVSKPKPYNYHNETFKPLGKGSRVFVIREGSTIIGYVLAVDDRDRWNKLYKVSTPYGIINDVKNSEIQSRYYQDLSHVVIPEELKKVSTTTLLAELRLMTFSGEENGSYLFRINHNRTFTEDEVRAELRTRPNIRNKRGAKIVNKSKRHVTARTSK